VFRVCFIPKPVAVALYAVLDTCLVIDSGANHTVISPLVNLEVITSAVKCIPIGGTHLTRLLLDCVRTKGVDAAVIVFKSLLQTGCGDRSHKIDTGFRRQLSCCLHLSCKKRWQFMVLKLVCK